MSDNNRVLWSEGMFLGPHHFQQHDRFILNSLSGINSGSQPHPYGFSSLEIDEAALAEGKLSLLECSGVFSDGTPFSLPKDAPLPEPVIITIDDIGKIISLGIPFPTQSQKDVAEVRDQQSFSRYLLQDRKVLDRQTPDSDTEEPVFTAELWVRLLIEGTDETAFHTIPVAKIKDRKEDGAVVIDSNHFPCAMSIQASNGLFRQCREIEALLTQRAVDLSAKVGRPDSGDSAQLTQFFMLQIINRATPLMKHLVATAGIHPEVIFRELVQIVGDLSTFCSANRIAPELPNYNHRNQFLSFDPVMQNLKQNLNFAVDQKVAQFPVEHIKGGIFTCTIPDTNLFNGARFLLAVSARMQTDTLINQFSPQTTIASKDKLRDFVTTHTTGVALMPLAQVPNNIPMYDNFVYFEMERGTSMWTEIAVTGIIAMHVSGNFPEIQLQLWTINQ